MLEPRFIEEGGWKHLEICEHNWLACPGIWGVEALSEELRARKVWLHMASIVRKHLDFLGCVCAKRALQLFDERLEALPEYQSVETVALILSECRNSSSACPRLQTLDTHPRCHAFEVLRVWQMYCRGYVTAIELTNKIWDWFGDFTYTLHRKGDREKSHLQSTTEYESDVVDDLLGNPFRPIEICPDWLKWQNGIIGSIAQSIYDDFVFDNMPILADALEEAGCTSVEILTHCREAKFHTRGCWVLDLLLRK